MIFKRIFVPPCIYQELEGVQFELTGMPARYVSRTLRANVGDSFHLMDGQGHFTEVEAISFSGRSVTCRVLRRFESNDGESPLSVELICAMPQQARWELILEKMTELGLTSLIPVFTQYSSRSKKEKMTETRRQRWLTICGQAARQCGRSLIPKLSEPIPLQEVLLPREDSENLIKIVLEQQGEPISRFCDNLDFAPQKKWSLLVGPEGGFSGEEKRAINNTGFRALTLGERILRTETAAISGLITIQTLSTLR